MLRYCLPSAALLFITARALSFDAVTLADYSGAELFERFCASCHGESGRGDGPVARALRVAPPDLTTITRRYGEFPAAQIRATIDGRGLIDAHGPREMPIWGYEFWVESGADVVAEDEMHALIDKLVEHLRTLQTDSA
jgi:mono/diheme cytochrome c family protein